MEQGRVAMQRVGEQGESATATTLRWKTAIDDLRLGIGQAFIPALEAIRRPVLDLVERYGPRLVEWANIAGRWLGENIPRAIAILEAIWNRVFPEAQRIVVGFWDAIRPALLWVQDIMQRYYTTYLPYLRDAWDILREGWAQIVNIYRTQLKPALQELWDALNIGKGASFDLAGAMGHFQGFMIKLYASGIIELIKGAIKGLVIVVEALIKAYEIGVHWGIRIRDVLNSMIGVFNDIRHWISVVVEKFNHFKSTLSGFQLPWWLTPGSPTPLETGLAGIGKMLAEVQGLAGGGLAFGGMTLAGAGAMGGGGGGGVTTISITNNFGVDSIRSDEDVLAVANATIRSLELRGIGPVL